MNCKLLRFFFLILLCAGVYRADAQCQYQLDMFDTYGDGWNGGVLKITAGPNTYTFTLDNFNDDGIDSTLYFDVTAGLPVVVFWSPGAFANEVSFNLYNNDGTLLHASGMLSTSPGLLYTAIAACPSCLKPANVKIENVYDTRAKLRWSPAPSSDVVGWWVIYGPQGFVPGPGVGDTVFVATPKVTLTGLQKKTRYDFYVVQQCDTTDYSTKVGPIGFETYWTNDVGISKVISPVNGCDLGPAETVTVVLTNYGAAPQTLLPFRYSVNGLDAGVAQPTDGFFTGVLGKDSSTVIEFETTFDFSAPGEYVIAVYTQLGGDEEPLNDTTFYYVNNRLVAPYFQNFETWNGGWYVDTTSVAPSWDFGDPEKFELDTAASGVNAWVTSLTGVHNSNEKSYLRSPCFDFSGLTVDPSIQFSLFKSLEADYDGAWLEMSLDGGIIWEKVGMQDEGLNWYNNFNTESLLGDVWDGQSGGWVQAQHRLPGASGISSVQLRFAFQSDPFQEFGGVGIDDVRIFVTPTGDLAGLDVRTLGAEDECGFAADSVTLRLTNLGTEPKSFFQVAYSINGGAPVIENVGPTVVAPDEQFTYTFNTTFDSRNGKFDIRAWTILIDEQNLSNDTTLIHSVDHTPLLLPLQEDFESGFTLPAGWITNGYITNGNNNTSYVLTQNLFEFNSNYSTLLPRFGLVGANDSLRFDYRITDYPDGTEPTILSNGTQFTVQISADCGPFETVYAIDSTTHVPTADLTSVAIGLEQYAGQTIQIRFQGTWQDGDFFFDLDNINLRACAVDLDLTADVTPATPGQDNGQATVNAGAGDPPFTYKWSNGPVTQTVTNLAIGQYTVTVTDAAGCTAALTLNIGSSGIDEITGLTRLVVQPNPTAGQAQLTATFEQPVDVQLELVNLLGQRLWTTSVERTASLTQEVDLSAFADGIYLVRLTVAGQTMTRKLVKNRN